MRSVSLVIGALLVALAVAPADAGRLRRCRRLCAGAATDCLLSTHQSWRKCKRQVIRQCRREGLQVCLPSTTTSTVTTTTTNTATTAPAPTTPTSAPVTTTTAPLGTFMLQPLALALFPDAEVPDNCLPHEHYYVALLLQIETRNLPGELPADGDTSRWVWSESPCNGGAAVSPPASVRAAWRDLIFGVITTDPSGLALCTDRTLPASGTTTCSIFFPHHAPAVRYGARVSYYPRFYRDADGRPCVVYDDVCGSNATSTCMPPALPPSTAAFCWREF